MNPANPETDLLHHHAWLELSDSSPGRIQTILIFKNPLASSKTIIARHVLGSNTQVGDDASLPLKRVHHRDLIQVLTGDELLEAVQIKTPWAASRWMRSVAALK